MSLRSLVRFVDVSALQNDVNTLLARLTAARAALIDQITAARMEELDPAGLPTDTFTLLDRLTATRAALIDNLDALISGRLSKADFDTKLPDVRAAYLDNLLSVEASATISHPSGIAETDAMEITPAELMEYPILLLDMNALTQNTTIRTYITIDGTNSRLINSAVFPTDFPTNAKGVPVVLYPMSVPWKITLQSAIAEGAARDIPYRYVRRSLV